MGHRILGDFMTSPLSTPLFCFSNMHVLGLEVISCMLSLSSFPSLTQEVHQGDARTKWACKVCKIGLCLNETRNCFYDFHKK